MEPYPATKLRGPLKRNSLPSPSTTVLAQDAAEQRMEGEDDSLGLFPGKLEILTQWRYDLASLYPGIKMEWEWYRHSKRCNTLWLLGNVSTIRFTDFKKGCDYRWYSGEEPKDNPLF
jgi:hypothetical protein